MRNLSLADPAFLASNPGVPWTPAAITTALWLDAADIATVTQSSGQVTAWSDKSGNNRIANANGNPKYNGTGLSTGKPAIELDGTDDYFIVSIPGISTFSALDVYMVTQTAAAAAADTNTAFFWSYGNFGAAGAGYPAQVSLGLVASTTALTGETIAIGADSTSAQAGRLGASAYSRAANTAQILNSRCSTSGSSLNANGSAVLLNLNNIITTTTNTSPSSRGWTFDSNFNIGAVRSSGALAYSPAIKFAEILVTSTLLAVADRQRLEGYLAWKWNLVAGLPGNHPYKFVPPTL